MSILSMSFRIKRKLPGSLAVNAWRVSKRMKPMSSVYGKYNNYRVATRATSKSQNAILFKRPTAVKYLGQGYMPPQFINRVTFSESHEVVGTAGFQEDTYKGNDVHDPHTGAFNRTAVGVSEMKAVYSHYKVISAKCTITVTNNLDQAVNVAIVPKITASAFVVGQKDEIPVQPNTGHVRCSKNDGLSKCSSNVSTAALYGFKDLDDVGFRASVLASPVHLWHFHVCKWTDDGSDMDCSVRVYIDFITLWSNPQIAEADDV